MLKKIFTILIGGIIVLIATGCGQKYTSHQYKRGLDQEIIQCLENELGAYLVSENDTLVQIPLNEIKTSDTEKFDYYKGVYASNQPENRYVMVYPKNGAYDTDVMQDFNKYFVSKYSIYQRYDSPLTPTIYIHNSNNDIDFKDISKKCITKNNLPEGKTMPTDTLGKLNKTTKIAVIAGEQELGSINRPNKIAEVLTAISSSEMYEGIGYLCDGHSLEFAMYDNDNNLIDTIYIWNDGERLIPASIHSGCMYYGISNDTDLRKIIEKETEIIFYTISNSNYNDNDSEKNELIYQDANNSYYVNNESDITIKFELNNKIMSLKYALENKYISAEKVASEYPNILLKK